MNDNESISIAIRKKDGDIEDIVQKKESITKTHPALDIFLLRGIIKFFEGSANQFYAEKKSKEKSSKNDKLITYLIFSFVTIIGMIMYFFVPTIIAFYFKNTFQNNLFIGLTEGILRFLIFIVMFFSIVLFERNSGTAKYHGAEHKVLWCYRKGKDLTLENVKKYSRLYPACGTGLIFYMILFSIPLFLLFGYNSIFIRLLLILISLPLLIGISFELSLFNEKKETKIAKVLSAPVLFLQKFNTKEPEKEHLEIAMIAIKNLIKCRTKND